MNAVGRSAPARRFALGDLVAGVSVALVAVPQSMAYAELAGLPAHHGLYAVSLPLVVAALFASSPFLQTGPVATTALLTFGALVPLAAPGSPQFVGLAALLALVVGVVRLAVGLTKGGWISYLMSRPVLEGFMLGAAVLIVASQLPGAMGSGAPDGSVLGRAAWTLGRPETWSPVAMAYSLGTVAIILGARRVHPAVPGVLVAAAGGLVLSSVTAYPGEVIGAIPEGLPPVSLDLPWRRLPTLVLPGVVIALVGFAEASSISRAFASEDRSRWDANREFVGQGAANVVSGLVGGFPVGGSFARSSLNRLVGARSRWSGLVTGLAVLALLPFAGFMAPLPRAVLAGIVIAAASSLLDPRKLMSLLRASKPQGVVAWMTALFTVALSPHVEQAVILGVVASGAIHLWRELQIRTEARREGSTLYLQPSGVLWFASAPMLDDQLLEHVAAEPDVDRVIIDCRGLGRIDLTGALALAEMLDHLETAGIRVTVMGVPAHARRVLKRVGAAGAPRSAGPGKADGAAQGSR